jgi:hypothetical protein
MNDKVKSPKPPLRLGDFPPPVELRPKVLAESNAGTPPDPRLSAPAQEISRALNRQLWGSDNEPGWDDLRSAAKKALIPSRVIGEVTPTALGKLPSEDR